MQLVSNKFADLRSKDSRSTDLTVGTDEQDWEGFGEEEPEKYVDAPKSDGTALVGKNTRKSEKKRRKLEERQKKRAASKAKKSQNAFEALGTANEGEDIVDNEEGDGKQKWMFRTFGISDHYSICMGNPEPVFSDTFVSGPHEVLAADCDTTICYTRNLGRP